MSRCPDVGERVEDSATGRQGTVLAVHARADAVTALDSDGETVWTLALGDALVLDGDAQSPEDDDEPLAWISELD